MFYKFLLLDISTYIFKHNHYVTSTYYTKANMLADKWKYLNVGCLIIEIIALIITHSHQLFVVMMIGEFCKQFFAIYILKFSVEGIRIFDECEEREINISNQEKNILERVKRFDVKVILELCVLVLFLVLNYTYVGGKYYLVNDNDEKVVSQSSATPFDEIYGENIATYTTNNLMPEWTGFFHSKEGSLNYMTGEYVDKNIIEEPAKNLPDVALKRKSKRQILVDDLLLYLTHKEVRLPNGKRIDDLNDVRDVIAHDQISFYSCNCDEHKVDYPLNVYYSELTGEYGLYNDKGLICSIPNFVSYSYTKADDGIVFIDVLYEDGTRSLFNPEGKCILNGNFNVLSIYSGLDVVLYEKEDESLYYLVDYDGNELDYTLSSYIEYYADDYYSATLVRDNISYFVIFSKTDQILESTDLKDAIICSDDGVIKNIIGILKNDKYVLLDVNGNRLLPDEYKSICKSLGTTFVVDEDYNIYILDSEYNLLNTGVTGCFDSHYVLEDEPIRVYQGTEYNRTYNFIDHSGSLIFDDWFDYLTCEKIVGSYYIAADRADDKVDIYDASGTFVITADSLYDFKKSKKDENKTNIVNKGESIYSYIKDEDESYAKWYPENLREEYVYLNIFMDNDTGKYINVYCAGTENPYKDRLF